MKSYIHFRLSVQCCMEDTLYLCELNFRTFCPFHRTGCRILQSVCVLRVSLELLVLSFFSPFISKIIIRVPYGHSSKSRTLSCFYNIIYTIFSQICQEKNIFYLPIVADSYKLLCVCVHL